jgi:hypothetical protein
MSGYHLYDIEYTSVTDTDQVATAPQKSYVYPNPVRGGEVTFVVGARDKGQGVSSTVTRIQQLPEISIYNIRGQLIKKSKNFTKKGNDTVYIWDKKDEQGQEVATGVYLYRINGGGVSQRGKFLIIK